MVHYNPPTPRAAAFCPSAAPSPQFLDISMFSAETAIKVESVETDIDMSIDNDLLEDVPATVSDNHDYPCVPFVDRVGCHSLRTQDGEHDLEFESNSCLSSPYQTSGVVFDSPSFIRMISHPFSSTEKEHSSPPTRPSSSLQNYYTVEDDLGIEQVDEGEDQQQRENSYRGSSVASVVTSRFSGLSLAPASETPIIHPSSLSTEIPNAYSASAQAPFASSSFSSPTPTVIPTTSTLGTFASAVSTSLPIAAAASTSASSSVYFPPTASALHQKRRKALKQKIQVPRPKNCFMLYRSKVLPIIMAELGSINNKIISKIAAERWRAESEPVKVWYRNMAKHGKEEHARKNPGYKYAPLNRMKMVAVTTVSRLKRHEEGGDTKAIVVNGGGIEVDDNDAVDGNYDDASASNRRRSTRQRLQQLQQPIVSRSSLQSQVSRKRSTASLGLGDQPSSSSSSLSNKSRNVSLHHQDSYPPLHMSANPLSSPRPSRLSMSKPSSVFQADYPIAGPTSIYNLKACQNASEETLVDPIDHWTAHRYQDGSIYFNHASTLTSILPLSNPYKNKLGGTSMLSPAKLMMIDPKILLEKELPPLPHEMMPVAQHGSYNSSHSFNSHSFNSHSSNSHSSNMQTAAVMIQTQL
ncbi:hypothetical protein EC991_010634 [Linnemannia zychae]|nr:hypothetical protein EC991_010634 [Linnemannia zychae]